VPSRVFIVNIGDQKYGNEKTHIRSKKRGMFDLGVEVLGGPKYFIWVIVHAM
jgi:hypothetical protein